MFKHIDATEISNNDKSESEIENVIHNNKNLK